ncbi:endogenous retrovirus group K member 5 Gag polyprotein-like [Zonotrichia leucophrys gambelii]|uniref:endogenous retrovirus group K member 5 Gag polyprotein-like n=1 Tax=Zonotrichia leucophrys gambelii TaxID=257770 RepID=UPI003140688E
MGEAAAWQQPQQMTSLYKQVPVEIQVHTAQKIPMIDWAGIRMKLAKERILLCGTGDFLVPVNYDAQGQKRRWERINHEVVKDLAEAIRDNGLGSSHFKPLLKLAFNIYDLTPYDVRCLASMILRDTQVLMWDMRWRRALGELRTRYQGGKNANLTMAQLAGDPPEDNPVQQAERLPREVLSDIKKAAGKAILKIARAGVQDTIYMDIRQGLSESFSSFTDRLMQAVDQQVTDEVRKPHLLKGFAFANANEECKQIISALPHQTSLAEMLEACSKVGTPQHVASIMEERLGEQLEGQLEEWIEKMFQVQNERLDRVLANFEKNSSSPGGQCYKCGAFGHFKRNCPQMPRTEKPLDICPRCRKGKHLASECHSQTDVDGKPLPHPGNSKRSVHHQHMTTKLWQ